MKGMRIVVQIILLCLVLSIIGCGGGGESGGGGVIPETFSNRTFSGTWIMTLAGTPHMYISFDGNGTVTDVGSFNMASSPGVYQVNSGGTFTMALKDSDNIVFQGSGSLTNSTSGSITFNNVSGTISKVTDVSLCQGTYSGTISMNSTTYTISFKVSSAGVISNFSCDIPGVISASGNMYSIGTNSTLFITTNLPYLASAYSQILGWGTVTSTQLNGSFQNDSDDPNGTMVLTRQPN
jgi:hypothetical protein